MGTASIHEGVRRMRFSSLLDRTEAKELTQAAASELLGINVRTFQRWAERFEAEGDDGLVDLRMGRRSPRRAPEEELERMLGLFRDKYADFTVKHFHEQLQKRHGYVLGYTVTKLALHAAGLVRKAPKRSAHRKKRPRRPLPGMLLHQDGSRHPWIEGLPAMDLIVTMDDATSEIYSMLLVEEEGTASTFQALGEVIGEHGLFCALYTDRGSHYFYTPKAGEKVSKTQQTQVGRALSHLGIEHIAAYSPQARGRSERMFGTLQGRLPKDLRLAGIRTVEAANAWLKAHYIAEHNAAFAIKAEQPGTAFVADRHEAWREALCVIEERTVANDNTIAWSGSATAVAAEPAQAPLRQGRGAGSRISRWHRQRIPWPAPAGEVCRRRTADQPRRARAWQRARSRQGQALAGAQARVLDRSCARRRRDSAGRGGETGFKSNKETNKED
ncbi:transposase [Bradyrhizobium sp. LM2.7]